MKITRKTYDDITNDASDVACEYCHRTPDETEIQSAYASGTYICGDIECWNGYCWEWVWTGDVVEVTEEEINVCEGCEEEIDEGDICKYCKDDESEEDDE